MFDVGDFGYVVDDREVELRHEVIFKISEKEVSKDAAKASALRDAFSEFENKVVEVNVVVGDSMCEEGFDAGDREAGD